MKRWVSVLLGLVAMVSAGVAVWTYVDTDTASLQLVLAEVDGEVKLTDGTGQTLDVEVGRVLNPAERVATSAASQAVLRRGSESWIRLGPTSSLRVTSIDDDGAVGIELEDGAIEARVRPGSGALRVGSQGREVLATNADFTVGVQTDVMLVGAQRGSVSLSGVDVTLVEEGTVATVVDRHAEIGPVPEDLLLQVEWPETRRTAADEGVLTGQTSAGAAVMVEGSFGQRRVRADAQGSFRVAVPLGEGDNLVNVRAVDLFGNEAVVDGALQTRDTRGPTYSGGSRFGD